MFGNNKNQNNQNDQPELGNVVIHTMQDDLNSLKGPGVAKDPIYIKEEKTANQNSNIQNGQAPKDQAPDMVNPNSPFLNGNFKPTEPVVVNKPPRSLPTQPFSGAPEKAVHYATPPIAPNNPIQDEKKEFLKSVSEKNIAERQEKRNIEQENAKPKSKKLVFASIGIVIFLILLGGGYYFWINMNNGSSPAVSEQNNNQTESNNNAQNSNAGEPSESQENQIAKTSFSTVNPNILSIGIDSPNAQDINQLLVKTAAEIRLQQITLPLEFIVTDKNNAPVSFSDFANMSGIKLPSAIVGALGKDFSLYFYPDGTSMRLGLEISSTSAGSVKNLLLAEEKNLYADLAPIYIEAIPQNPAAVKFTNSTYGNYGIRYMNFSATASIDYAVGNGRLIIGTSKSTMHSILDRINRESSSQ